MSEHTLEDIKVIFYELFSDCDFKQWCKLRVVLAYVESLHEEYEKVNNALIEVHNDIK